MQQAPAQSNITKAREQGTADTKKRHPLAAWEMTLQEINSQMCSDQNYWFQIAARSLKQHPRHCQSQVQRAWDYISLNFLSFSFPNKQGTRDMGGNKSTCSKNERASLPRNALFYIFISTTTAFWTKFKNVKFKYT